MAIAVDIGGSWVRNRCSTGSIALFELGPLEGAWSARSTTTSQEVALEEASAKDVALFWAAVDRAIVVGSLMSGHFVAYEHPAEYHGNNQAND